MSGIYWVALFALSASYAESLDGLGVDYSHLFSKTLRNDVASQRRALTLLREANVSKVKIFSAEESMIETISDIWGSRELSLMVSVANYQLAGLAGGRPTFNQAQLDALVNALAKFSHRIEFIAVGNEPEYPAENNGPFMPLILPVMETIHEALVHRGVFGIRLTVPFADAMLPGIMAIHGPSTVNAFPDSYDSILGCNFAWCMNHQRIPLKKWVVPLLDFLNRTGGAWTMSVYPFFKWRDLSTSPWCQRYGLCVDIPLDFAVGAPTAKPVKDRGTGLVYKSLMAMMVDAVRVGLAQHGYPELPFMIGETGWPTGGMDHPGVGVAAACHFSNNLAALVHEGTPAAPGVPFRAYLFEWLDEDGKWDFLGRPNDPGIIEDNWGLLTTALQPKYPLDWTKGRAKCPPMPPPVNQRPAPWEATPIVAEEAPRASPKDEAENDTLTAGGGAWWVPLLLLFCVPLSIVLRRGLLLVKTLGLKYRAQGLRAFFEDAIAHPAPPSTSVALLRAGA